MTFERNWKDSEQKGVAVGLGQTVNVPPTLQVGGLSETVQVTSAPDIIDTRTTTTGANLSQRMLPARASRPNSCRPLLSGARGQQLGTAGAANPSIAGGSGLDNHYVIDGVNVTNQGYGALGSYSIIFGSLGNATPFDFIAGSAGEDRRLRGRVRPVDRRRRQRITKSGTNTLHGRSSGTRGPTGWRATGRSSRASTAACRRSAHTRATAAPKAAVPIIRNKLFFFGAIDPGAGRARRSRRRRASRCAASATSIASATTSRTRRRARGS